MSKDFYVRMDEYQRRHHVRYAARVAREGLTCQDCGGDGGHVEVIDYYIGGPWEQCDWCEGTGKVTRWLRGQWLRCKRQEAELGATTRAPAPITAGARRRHDDGAMVE